MRGIKTRDEAKEIYAMTFNTKMKKSQPTGPIGQQDLPAVVSSRYSIRGIFGDLKIGMKLILAFGILVAIALVMVWLAYQSSAQAIHSNSMTREFRAPAVLAATQAQSNLLKIRSSIRSHLIFGDEQSRQEYVYAQNTFLSDLKRLQHLYDTQALESMGSDFEHLTQLSERMFSLRNNLLENEPAQRILVNDADINFRLVLDKIKKIAQAQARRPSTAGTIHQLVAITDFQRSYALKISALRRYIGSGSLVYKQEYQINNLENDVAWSRLKAERDNLSPYQQVFLDEMEQLFIILKPLPDKMIAIVESDRTREDLFLFKTEFAPKSDELLTSLDNIVSEQTELLEAQLSASSKNLRLTQQQTLIGSVLALLFGSGLALFFQRAISSPIVRLTQTAIQLSEGNLSVQAPAESRDEIGILAQTFNKMTIELRRSIRGLEDQAGQLSKANQELIQEVAVRKDAEAKVRSLNEELEQRVLTRTAELNIAKEQAEAANRAKSTFLASMSHELRTPLNSILGYAQVLKRYQLEPRVIDSLDVVRQSGEHLLALINDVLDISKIEADRMELFAQPFHLSSFLHQITSIIEARAELKNLSLAYEAQTPLPKIVISDEQRLRQVLLNLLGNAVKFTQMGHVTLTVQSLSEVTPQSHQPEVPLRFSVEDSGCGIAPRELEQIFIPFEQAGDPEKRIEGTGLGLAISQRILQLMNSRLQVESKPGQGSTFWFDLKLTVGEEPGASIPAETDSVVGYRGKRRKILIADDKLYNRLVLKEMLEPLGFEICVVNDGRQAVEQINVFRPDVVIMDILMPVMTGIEAVSEIRSNHEFDNVYILAASASVLSADKEKSLLAGCDCFLPKPINMADLLDLLKKNLNLTWMYREADKHKLSQNSIIPPPEKELNELYRLAESGRVLEIQQTAVRLKTEEQAYISFAETLQQLARDFELDKIATFVKQFMKEEPKWS